MLVNKLGDDHPDVASTYENIGLLYEIKLKKYKEALDLYRKALKIKKLKFGDEHRKTKRTMRLITRAKCGKNNNNATHKEYK